MESEMKCCETCCFWSADDSPHGDSRPVFASPHSVHGWGTCMAALEGWRASPADKDCKMAVWDQETYAASLTTRSDHVCGEWDSR